MDCPACGHRNREGAQYCAECGTPLIEILRCPSCGAARPAAAKYCDRCGHALVPERAPDPRASPPEHLARKIRAGRSALEGERKQVTVLFADVMGSMALSEQSGAEAWRAVMDRFFSILSAGVHRFEGTVDKFTGDGVMALFGAPIADEDHARRACLAALELQRETARFVAELRRNQGLGFSVRIGLNSGEVVVGEIGDDLAMTYTAIGHTVGLAQRMEQLAEPGRIYVTEHTARLVEGYLALADLGEFRVPGVRGPLRVNELTGIGAARGSLDVSRARGFSPFVGREEDLGVLESALSHAVVGQGRVVGIIGEAGVGKSRLCHEFVQRARADGTPVYHVAGQAHTRSVPLLPVLQFLRDYFEVGERDPDATARERIAGRLALLDASFDEELPLLFHFLAVPDPERPAPQMHPEARQRRLLALMKRLRHAESSRAAGITLVEDVHWLDPASEAFLATQIEAVPGTRSLIVLNFRPEYHAAWMSRSFYHQHALAPLGAQAIEELLVGLLGPDPTLDGLLELIRERTQGNPFFVEELVKSLAETGSLEGERGAYHLAGPVDHGALPASVQAVLGARIDRLARREKAVLDAAAVIGREFAEPLLTRVLELPQEEVQDALAELVAGEFVFEQQLDPEPRYAFKHPLTQQVAYRSQLSERRAAVHAAVAAAMVEQYPERLDERAALVAQHWKGACETLQAARWYARAAVWAGSSDPTQALRHWREVRELADELPASAESRSLGLQARVLSLELGWRLGLSREQAEAEFREAEALSVAMGDVHAQALAVLAYGSNRGLNNGEVGEYAELARRAIALADESGDPALITAVASSPYALFCAGEYRAAVAILDRAIERADGDATLGAGVVFACPYAFIHALKGLNLAALGELEEARRLIVEGRGIARGQGDIETIGVSDQMATGLAYFAGEPDAALVHAQHALQIAERIGSSFSRSHGWFFLGLAQWMRGDWSSAVEAVERSSEIAKERRTAIELDAWRLVVLGESRLALGEPERALRLVHEAGEVARAQGHVFNQTLAGLALARVLLGSTGVGAREEIQAALEQAFALARETGAKAFEPLIGVERAELARQSDDEELRERELREAQRLFTRIGAAGHAGRLAAQLPARAS